MLLSVLTVLVAYKHAVIKYIYLTTACLYNAKRTVSTTHMQQNVNKSQHQNYLVCCLGTQYIMPIYYMMEDSVKLVPFTLGHRGYLGYQTVLSVLPLQNLPQQGSSQFL